jgi:hypothetical protein
MVIGMCIRKETTLEQMIKKTKDGWMYKLLHCVHKSIAEGYINTITAQASVIAAYASPKEDTIYIRTDVSIPSYMMDALIAHEEGHIKDYKNRGRIRFYTTVVISYIQKIPIMTAMSKADSLEEANALTLKYHNTSIERYANKEASLDPHVFCLNEQQVIEGLLKTGEITQEEYDAYSKGGE